MGQTLIKDDETLAGIRLVLICVDPRYSAVGLPFLGRAWIRRKTAKAREWARIPGEANGHRDDSLGVYSRRLAVEHKVRKQENRRWTRIDADEEGQAALIKDDETLLASGLFLSAFIRVHLRLNCFPEGEP